MKKVTLELPWPPSVNKMYTRNFHLTKDARSYYKACHYDILTQFGCGKVPKFLKKVTMQIEFYPRRNGGWDESNHIKAPEDAIVKAGIIPDDQVKYLHLLEPITHERVRKDELPYIKITLEEK